MNNNFQRINSLDWVFHTNIKTFWNEFILNLNIKALSEVQRSSYIYYYHPVNMDQIYQAGNTNVWLLLPFLNQNWYVTFLGGLWLMYTSIMALLHLKLQFNLVKVKVSGCIDIIFQCCPKVESFHPTLAKSNILHHLLTSEQFSPQYGKWIHLSYQIRCTIPS